MGITASNFMIVAIKLLLPVLIIERTADGSGCIRHP